MKKVFVICALLLTAASAVYAQKKNVTKAQYFLEDALMDPKHVNYERADMAWGFIEQAMKNPESVNMAKTWNIAGNLKVIYSNKMLMDRSSTGNMNYDAFFDLQYDIVTFFSRCDSLERLPNKKGEVKEPEYRKANLELIKTPRQNLLIAGSQYVNSDLNKCIKFLDLYFSTFSDPFMAELNFESTDTMKYDAYYILGNAYEQLKDTAKVIPAYEQAVNSETYGKNACFGLMQIYKNRGQNDKWLEYCELGVKKFPNEPVFSKVLLGNYIENKRWDDALKIADLLIKNEPDDEWAYYNKGLIYFESNRAKEAYEVFLQTIKIKPDYLEAYAAAGKAAWKVADTSKDKNVTKDYYNKAIEMFEKARELSPDDATTWGYSLYACYNNIGNTAKAKEFAKYMKQ